MVRERIDAVRLNTSLPVTIVVVLGGALLWLNQTIAAVQTSTRPLEIGAVEAEGAPSAVRVGNHATAQYRRAYDSTFREAAHRRDLQAATSQYRGAYEVMTTNDDLGALQAASTQYRTAYDGTFHSDVATSGATSAPDQ